MTSGCEYEHLDNYLGPILRGPFRKRIAKYVKKTRRQESSGNESSR
jgi:hypothetical protein